LSTAILTRDFNNFKKWNIQSYKQIKPSRISQSTSHGNASYYFMLLNKLAKFEKTNWADIKKEIKQETKKNYVLIIDEINRWNISKIFGELITLLEPTKRLWEDEELRVTLPYSQEDFGVPNNLHVIWTMNTADRSIALMDIALRRRFNFQEMSPDSSLLSNIMIWDIDIKRLFETINERITFLYDKDHQIWHSYFLKVKTKEDLDLIFNQKIIPLLQEYFYEDWEKIQIVLWDHNLQKLKSKDHKFIQEKNISEIKVLWFDYEETEDTYEYSVNKNINIQSYIWIYKTTLKIDSDNEE
jgi:5-methylcytosine-specific restriction protein B